MTGATVAHGRKIVTSAHPAATAAGLDAFARGGNAFDAALAACFMETIALPMKCGLAGDVVALFRSKHAPLRALISIGAGCGAIAQGAKLERLGPKSVGVPGAPRGYAALASFADLELAALTAPAVRAANAGIPWTKTGLSYLREAADILIKYNSATPYMPDGKIPNVGDVLALPGLGRLLERFAVLGSDLFLGEDGDRLVNAVRDQGGFLAREDLRRPTAQMLSVASTTVRGRILSATPLPTFGPRLLAVVEDAAATGKNLVDIVIADRQAARHKGRQPSQDGTSVVTAADLDGNAVVVVHSNSFPRFGSGVVLDDGLVLNNRPGRGFDLTAPPNAANAPKAGRVPPTTLHAWAMESDRGLTLGATPGGVNQLCWNAQSVLQLLDETPLETVVTSPRWALDEDLVLSLEGDMPITEAAGVSRATRVPPLSFRSAQQMIFVPKIGALTGAADPRVDCCAGSAS